MRDIEFYRLSDAVAKLGQVAAVLKQDMLMLLQLNQKTLERLEALEKNTNEDLERGSTPSNADAVKEQDTGSDPGLLGG